MKLITRNIEVFKSVAEVEQILASFAYYFPKPVFRDNSFSIYYSITKKIGYIFLIPIKGLILEKGQKVEVRIEAYSGGYFFCGCLISLLGIVGLIWYLIIDPSRWVPALGLVCLGMLTCIHYMYECVCGLEKLKNKILQ